MCRVAYRELYLRPSYLLRQLLRIHGWDDIRTNVQALHSIVFARATVSPKDLDLADGRPSSPALVAPAPSLAGAGR